MNVVGLDLSLSCTGLVQVQSDKAINGYKIKPKAGLKGLNRLVFIVGKVVSLAAEAEWVVVEGPAYGSQGNQQGHHERAGLWWLTAHALSHLGASTWIVVAPTALKKYAVGKGNASKDQVLSSVIKRYGTLIDVDDNNVADALVLAAMGMDALEKPLEVVPKLNREALAKIEWPVSTNLVV